MTTTRKRIAYTGIGIELILASFWIVAWNFHCKPFPSDPVWWILPWFLTQLTTLAIGCVAGAILISKGNPEL